MLNAVGLPELDTRNYRAIRDSLVEYGENFEDVDPEAIDWLDAEPTARPLRAMFLPDEHAVNATELVLRLEKAFLAAGGVLIAERAIRVDHAHGRVRGIALESGTVLRTGKTVLAAGAFSQDVLDTVPEQAVRIPRLVSGYGVSALVDTADGTGPPSVIRTPNRAFACGLHVVPRPHGQVYVGATNIISMQPRETPLISDVLFLLDCGNRQVRRGLADSGLRRIQVGNRPVSLDGMPLIGETGLSGLWMMTGTYRDGLTLSPLLAREMAALLLEEEATVDLEPFRPVRPPVQPAGREEVVEATVQHMLATGYESDWDVPLYWPATMEHYLREAYAQRAQDLDPDFTPPPELLAAVRTNPVLEKGLRDYYAASRTEAAGRPPAARRETVEQLRREAVGTLTGGGVPYPRQDADELLVHVLGSHEPQRRVSEEEAREVRALVARRAERVPIGHILGYARLGGLVSRSPRTSSPRCSPPNACWRGVCRQSPGSASPSWSTCARDRRRSRWPWPTPAPTPGSTRSTWTRRPWSARAATRRCGRRRGTPRWPSTRATSPTRTCWATSAARSISCWPIRRTCPRARSSRRSSRRTTRPGPSSPAPTASR